MTSFLDSLADTSGRLADLSAARAVALLSARKISAEELVRACLDRIASREPNVQAWQFFQPERALAQAREADRAPRSPLYGLPVGVKDIVDTFDMPTEYGCSFYRGHRAESDADCVQALRRSGAVILGKTVTTQLAYFTPGKTRNPHHPEHTPGGSSSGSAAAVAAGMIPIALGTQTAGSVIRPAAFCGVIGFKPTHGEFPIGGIKSLAPSLDTLGFFARSLSDLPLLAEVLSGKPWSSRGAGAIPRVGFCPTEQWTLATEDTRQLLSAAQDKLKRAGATVNEIEFPPRFRGLHDAQKVIMAVEMTSSLRPERHEHPGELGPELHQLFAQGEAARGSVYDSARAQAEECRHLIGQMFSQIDLILTPSAPGEAPAGLKSTGDPAFNRIWTLLHLPCIHLPIGRGTNGLPIGIQLVGPPDRDAVLCSAAEWVASALQRH
jgi:amidase